MAAALQTLKEHSWFVNLLLTLFVLALTQYQLHTQSRSIAVADCWLAESKGAEVVVTPDRLSIAFATRCAVRNVGATSVELIDIRSGFTLNGSLVRDPVSIRGPFETATKVVVNGDPFTKPIAIQPGGQASIDALLHFSIPRQASEQMALLLQTCTSEGEITTTDSLSACLWRDGLHWTDFLRGANRKVVDESEPSAVADGLAGVFMLSSGGFVFADVQFRYGCWAWNCGPSGASLRPPPRYARCDDLRR